MIDNGMAKASLIKHLNEMGMPMKHVFVWALYSKGTNDWVYVLAALPLPLEVAEGVGLSKCSNALISEDGESFNKTVFDAYQSASRDFNPAGWNIAS